MASTRPDPLTRRVGDVAYVLAVALADLVRTAVEDGARRGWARLHAKRHRVYAATRRP